MSCARAHAVPRGSSGPPNVRPLSDGISVPVRTGAGPAESGCRRVCCTKPCTPVLKGAREIRHRTTGGREEAAREAHDSEMSARRTDSPCAVALAALVLGAAYLVSKPGSEQARCNADSSWSRARGHREIRAGRDGGTADPGLALGIVDGGRIDYIRGFGTAGRFGEEGGAADAVRHRLGRAESLDRPCRRAARRGEQDTLDAPVQRYLTLVLVAERRRPKSACEHLLNHTSGLSTKTGRSFQGDGDTSDTALEQAVRKLKSAG